MILKVSAFRPDVAPPTALAKAVEAQAKANEVVARHNSKKDIEAARARALARRRARLGQQ